MLGFEPPAGWEAEGDFDEARAVEIVGKSLLFGLTYLDQKDNMIGQKQHFGEIIEASRRAIIVRLRGGEDDEELFGLPPAPHELEDAAPGQYTLRATGQVIENPDLIARITIYAAPEAED